MSKSINSDRKGYYKALKRTTGYIKKDNPMDITFWCEWFLKTLHSSLVEAIESIEHVVEKARFWDRHRDSNINERQTKVLNSILDRGVNHPQSVSATLMSILYNPLKSHYNSFLKPTYLKYHTRGGVLMGFWGGVT